MVYEIMLVFLFNLIFILFNVQFIQFYSMGKFDSILSTNYRYAEIGRSFRPTYTDYLVSLCEISSPVKILGFYGSLLCADIFLH